MLVELDFKNAFSSCVEETSELLGKTGRLRIGTTADGLVKEFIKASLGRIIDELHKP